MIHVALLLLLLLSPALAQAQPWSGILSTSRATDWSTAGATIPVRTNKCTTLGVPGQLPTFVQNVTAAQINSAIAACGSGLVVVLSPGTYTLSSGIAIQRSDVTLRGAGASLTRLKIDGAGPSCGFFYAPAISLCTTTAGGHLGEFGGATGGPGPNNATTWTAAPAGTTVITIAARPNLFVGSVIALDQVNDSADGFPAAGDIYMCDIGPPCSWEGGGSYYRGADGDGSTGRRAQVELHKVVSCGTSAPGAACTSNNITIDPPIIAPNYRAGQSPSAWWGNSGVLLENVGVEDLTIDFTDINAPPFGEVGVILNNTANCWIKGVRLINSGQTGSFLLHFLPIQSFRPTLRDSYLYGAASSSGNTNTNYAITSMIVTQALYENNILHHNVAPIAADDPETGSVYAYNYMTDAWSTGGPQPHNSGDLLNLWEGNNLGTFFVDAIHGTHFFYTLFRNHIDGRANNPAGPAEAGAGVVLASHSRFFNLVGNVIGYSGFTSYETGNPATGRNDALIYQLGFAGDHSAPTLANDTDVQRTLFRWGNWDNVNSARRFIASEVPSGITNFSNPVPANQVLPASFYRATQPTTWWSTPWGTPPWPPIGPDVTGGNISNSPTGGHANKIPARLCFENTALDGAYPSSSPRILNFNAATCYLAAAPSGPPGAPTSLLVTGINGTGLTIITGKDITMAYTEPSIYAGGGAITDLQSTRICYQLDGGPTTCLPDIAASSPSGGGAVSRNIALPVPLGFTQALTLSVTATNPSGASSPAQISKTVDRKPEASSGTRR